MPIFEYKCQDCGHKFDLLVSGSRNDKIKCPQCFSTSVNKLFSVFNTGSKSSPAPPNKCQTCNVSSG